MFFKPHSVSRMWDTWMFHHGGVFHLFYLVTETSLGEGVGLATSEDGVTWRDRGWVLRKSPEATWLGTGSVWPALEPHRPGRFIMNFSEWFGPEKTGQQVIRFAVSNDLLHWERLDNHASFAPDGSLYRHGEGMASRWDCISAMPVPDEKGYLGYWTADPAAFHPGFGFGRSADGIAWTALPPPAIAWEGREPLPQIEAGGVERIGDRYWLLAGSYRHYRGRSGAYAFSAGQPEGPFTPAATHFDLLASEERTSYFPRFFRRDGEVLVNHHVISVANERAFAPIKTAVAMGDGSLRLGWWPGNARAKGARLAIERAAAHTIETVRLEAGLFSEIEAGTGRAAPLRLTIPAGAVASEITLTGRELIVRPDPSGEGRERFVLPGKGLIRLRLLINGPYLEVYADDLLLQCFSLPGRVTGTLRAELPTGEAASLRAWRLAVPPV